MPTPDTTRAATGHPVRPSDVTASARTTRLGPTLPLTARTLGPLSAVLVLSSATLSFPFCVLASPPAPNNGGAGSVASGPSVAPTPVSPASPTPSADAQVAHATVTITDGAHPAQTITTDARTVAEALAQDKITLGGEDTVSPPLSASVSPQTPIVVTRVRTEMETENVPIPFKHVFKMSHDVPPCHIARGRRGVPGVLTKTFRAKYVNDTLAERTLVSKVVTRKPVDMETLGGIRIREARALPSRGGYDRTRCLSMTATGYSPYEGSGTGRCATGIRAGYGVVAVDPRVIRLGTKLYVEGYGYAVAGDTGGAIKGRRIDLGHTTHREASRVGRKHVRVWVLKPAG